MVDKEFNKSILKAAKIRLEPYDMFQKEDSYIWVDDNNWFLTIMEFIISPEEKAIFLNIGLNFLWYNKKLFTFDFLKEEISVKYENNDVFATSIHKLMQIAFNKAIYYRKFRDIFFAKEEILKSKFNVWKFNYFKMIICFLCGDFDLGKKYFKLFSNNVGLNKEINLFIDEQKNIFNSLIDDDNKLKNFVNTNVLNSIKEQRGFYKKTFISKLPIQSDLYTLRSLIS